VSTTTAKHRPEAAERGVRPPNVSSDTTNWRFFDHDFTFGDEDHSPGGDDHRLALDHSDCVTKLALVDTAELSMSPATRRELYFVGLAVA
jgi:hypothetical protein